MCVCVRALVCVYSRMYLPYLFQNSVVFPNATSINSLAASSLRADSGLGSIRRHLTTCTSGYVRIREIRQCMSDKHKHKSWLTEETHTSPVLSYRITQAHEHRHIMRPALKFLMLRPLAFTVLTLCRVQAHNVSGTIMHINLIILSGPYDNPPMLSL